MRPLLEPELPFLWAEAMTPERRAEIRRRVDRMDLYSGSIVYCVTRDDVQDLLAALDEREQQIAAVREWRERMRGRMVVEGDLDDLLAALDAAPKAVGE